MTLREEVASFLTHEAQLLDEQRWDDWLALLTEDFRYWMPVDKRQKNPKEGVAHIHDDHPMMSARLHRLANPRAFASEPPPSTVRLVGSISAEEGEMVTARSSLILLEYRERGTFETDTRTFGAHQTHTLLRISDGFKVAMKRVDVLGAGGSFNALAVPF